MKCFVGVINFIFIFCWVSFCFGVLLICRLVVLVRMEKVMNNVVKVLGSLFMMVSVIVNVVFISDNSFV